MTAFAGVGYGFSEHDPRRRIHRSPRGVLSPLMLPHHRRVWGGACLGFLVLLSGCATRASVQRLHAEVAALQAKVEETNRNLGQTFSMTKESEGRLGERLRGVEAIGQKMERLEARFQDVEGTIRDVKASVEALTAQVAKLTTRPPADSAERLYASAQAQYQARNLGQAVLEFSELLQSFPRHPLAENAQYWIGAAYLAHQDFRQAAIEFRKVVDQYPGGSKAPDALYQLGLSYRNLFEPRRAREMWERVIRDHPGSDGARLARTAMRGGAAPRPK